MHPDCVLARTIFLKQKASLVLVSEDIVRTFQGRGIGPLLSCLQADSNSIRGCSVADRVIGKAAALLMVFGGVREVWTEILSVPAAEVFRRTGISFVAEQTVERIRDRDGTGLCPMEQLCLTVNNPAEAYWILSNGKKV